MTKGRVVQHGLSGDKVVVRKEVNEAIESARLSTLRSIVDSNEWISLSEIVCESSVSRQTVSSHLEYFVSNGLANYDPNSRKYTVTAGGVFVLDSFDLCLKTISEEHLGTLTRSDHAINVLRELHVKPTTPRILASKPNMPSKSTVWRLLSSFIDFDLIEKQSGEYYLNEDGYDWLTTYETLEMSIAVCFEKAPILQRLDPNLVIGENPLPVAALASADLIATRSNSPGLVTTEAIRLADPRIKQFSCVTSIYNPALFRMYYRLVGLGMASEGIIDDYTYKEICKNPKLHKMLDNSKYDHYSLYRLERSLTLGIGLYNSRKIAIGAYNHRGRGQHTAVVISEHQDLIEWGKKVCQSLRDEAIMTEIPNK